MSTEAQNMTTTENTEGMVAKTTVPGGKKKKMKWGKVAIPVVIVALAAAFFLRPGGGGDAGTFYNTSEATYRDLEVLVSDSGTVEPADSYTITALVSGEVLSADFEEGDQVEEDDLLYTIDAGDLDQQIEQAQLGLQQAQIQYDNVVIGTTPYTPTAGRVKEFLVKVGDSVNAGSPVATVAASDNATITLSFHRADALNFNVGDVATLTLEGNMEQITGTVTKIGWEDVSGFGGALLRNVEISTENRGALTTLTASAEIKGAYSTAPSTFEQDSVRTIYAETSGTITTFLVGEGDWVGADARLCTIGGVSAENAVKNADIAVSNAAISLDSVMDMLDNYEITAPISGTVIDKEYKVGDNVESTGFSPMAVIYDMSYLTFTLNIDELDVNKLKVGQTVRITADAIPDGEFTGVVDKVSINGTTMNGVTTYPVTVLVDDGGDLLPGMNVSADILIRQVENVLTIPVDAVSRDNTVQVLPADGYDKNGNVDASKLQTVTVELGQNDANYIEVLSGLSEGDIVVTINKATNIMEAMMNMGGGMPGGGLPGGMGM